MTFEADAQVRDNSNREQDLALVNGRFAALRGHKCRLIAAGTPGLPRHLLAE